jgi:hypothetical protein
MALWAIMVWQWSCFEVWPSYLTPTHHYLFTATQKRYRNLQKNLPSVHVYFLQKYRSSKNFVFLLSSEDGAISPYSPLKFDVHDHATDGKTESIHICTLCAMSGCIRWFDPGRVEVWTAADWGGPGSSSSGDAAAAREMKGGVAARAMSAIQATRHGRARQVSTQHHQQSRSCLLRRWRVYMRSVNLEQKTFLGC